MSDTPKKPASVGECLPGLFSIGLLVLCLVTGGPLGILFWVLVYGGPLWFFRQKGPGLSEEQEAALDATLRRGP
jgi:hypothetical protein